MQEINEGAGALSTYGLYAVVSALTVCVIYLYKRTVALEEKFREYVSTSSEKVSELQKGLLQQTTTVLSNAVKAIEDSTDAIKHCNEIMATMNAIMGERR